MNSQEHNSFTSHSKKNFTLLDNDIIRSADLSCKAFKLLSIGLSHSGSWQFNRKQINTCFKEGMHTVDEAMKELRSLGHLHLKAKKGNGSQFAGHLWFWFEDPISEEEFKKFYRDPEIQGFGEFGVSETPPDIRIPSLKNTNSDKKINKVNEGTLPFSKKKKKEPRDFLTTPEEKTYFDSLMKSRPEEGEPLDPKAVSYWIKNWGIERVKEAVMVYRQQVDKHKRNPSVPIPRSMGKYVRRALNKGTKPSTEETDANKRLARELSKKHPFIEVLEKYVKIVASTFKEELYYSMPIDLFKQTIRNKIETALAYSL